MATAPLKLRPMIGLASGRFLPWLISSREGMLKELFSETTETAIRVDTPPTPVTGWKKPFERLFPQRYSAKQYRSESSRRSSRGSHRASCRQGSLPTIFVG